MNKKISVSNKFKVAYATGSRADYGIVRKYLNFLQNDDEIDLSILVTGSHLEDKYGMTNNIIKEDGFTVKLEAKLNIDNSSNSGITNSIANGIEEFGNFFECNKFDLLIILGDRYEMLSVAIAASIQGINILHIHGGEITYGNYDEFIRHSITKMSKFHFTSTEVYRKRVIQMGEPPENVFNYGAMGAENCTKINIDNVLPEISRVNKDYFVVIFHPETATGVDINTEINTLLESINMFKRQYKFVFIGTNADTNSDIISNAIKKYCLENNMKYYNNLNSDSFLFLVKGSLGVIGNSSSGIIEAPSLGVPSINIGKRQSGRERANSIIDIDCDKKEIINSIQLILDKKISKNILNPYFNENSSELFYLETKKILSRNNTNAKKFYDIPSWYLIDR